MLLAARAAASLAVLGALLISPAPSSAQPGPVQPVAPAPLPPPASAAPSATAPGCGEGWVRQVYAARRSQVVLIEAINGLGAGFIFHSPRHVATAFHVVDLGRPVSVVLNDGRRLPARVVAVDRARDLALLELPIDPGIVPLAPAPGLATVGDPVLAVGHPYATRRRFDPRLQGLLSWSATLGIVSARGQRFLQTDAAVNPGNSGGPLFDCRGQLLGVVSAKLRGEGIGFVVPVEHVSTLIGRIGQQSPYRGRLSTELQLGLGLGFRPGSNFLGPVLGGRLVVRDRWQIGVRGVFLFDVTPAPPEEGTAITLSQLRTRLLAELDLGYRLLLGRSGSYLVPSLGAFVGAEDLRRRRLGLVPAAEGCQNGDPGCALGLRQQETQQRTVVGGPQFGVLLRLSVLEIDYAFQLRPDDAGTSIHRLLLGFKL